MYIRLWRKQPHLRLRNILLGWEKKNHEQDICIRYVRINEFITNIRAKWSRKSFFYCFYLLLCNTSLVFFTRMIKFFSLSLVIRVPNAGYGADKKKTTFTLHDNNSFLFFTYKRISFMSNIFYNSFVYTRWKPLVQVPPEQQRCWRYLRNRWTFFFST